jgi:hypothetical protein
MILRVRSQCAEVEEQEWKRKGNKKQHGGGDTKQMTNCPPVLEERMCGGKTLKPLKEKTNALKIESIHT